MHYVAIEESRRDLLKQLQERVPVEDLVDRRLDDLYGATLSIWQFLQHHDPQSPKVRIFNPDFEEHGWQSTHTFVAVLHEDTRHSKCCVRRGA